MNISKVSDTKGLKFLYTNADQFINKRDDLIMIPKKNENPITHARLDIDGYKYVLYFDPDEINLGVSGKRCVAIYHKESLKVSEVEFEIDGFTDDKWIEVSSRTLGHIIMRMYISQSF